MRAETSNPTASAVRKAAPDARSRSATASAAGSTVPLACEPVNGSHSKAPMSTPLASADEAGSERIEDGDLEVLDEGVRQAGELRLRHEAGERARLIHAPERPCWSTAIRSRS